MSADKRNIVYIITGKNKESLNNWYSGIKHLGIVSENGCQYKNEQQQNWENLVEVAWLDDVEEIFKKYEYLVVGSYVQRKSASIVWWYSQVDLIFGRKQADQLIKELKKKFLNSRDANIIRGDNYVEVKPFGMNKGTITEILIKKTYLEKGKIDFILAIGNSLQDEDIFASINKTRQYHNNYFVQKSSQYLCTVKPKQSDATFYLKNVNEVEELICKLANPQ